MVSKVENSLMVKNCFEKYYSVKSILIKGKKYNEALKYSIVIPTYKRVSTLKSTLESALNQDYTGEYNIIVCDNNPERNDETELFMQTISDNRITYYKNAENIGMAGNWNRCVELCDGKYFIMIHDDDLIYTTFISQCDKILNKYNDIKFLYLGKKNWYQTKDSNPPQPDNITTAKLFKMDLFDFLFNGIAPSGIIFSKEETIRLGGFDESTHPIPDLYFNIKIINNSKLYFYTMPLTIYRWSINESYKYKTLLGFLSLYNPLRIWIGKKIGLPYYIIRCINRNYNYNNYNIIKEKVPNELNNPDIKKIELPNKLEVFVYMSIHKIINRRM